MGTSLVERGITRYDIDDQGTYGYMVRISRSGNQLNQFFSDKKYKGKRKALDAARKKLKQLVKQLPPPQTTRGVKTSRNQTGVVGVHLAICESIYGEEYSSYCASWKIPLGSRKKLSFSFKKYGKKNAFALACLARELESTDREAIENRYESKTGKPLKHRKSSKPTARTTKKKVTKKKAAKKKPARQPAARKATKKKVAKKKPVTPKPTKRKTVKKKALQKKKASKKR